MRPGPGKVALYKQFIDIQLQLSVILLSKSDRDSSATYSWNYANTEHNVYITAVHCREHICLGKLSWIKKSGYVR